MVALHSYPMLSDANSGVPASCVAFSLSCGHSYVCHGQNCCCCARKYHALHKMVANEPSNRIYECVAVSPQRIIDYNSHASMHSDPPVWQHCDSQTAAEKNRALAA